MLVALLMVIRSVNVEELNHEFTQQLKIVQKRSFDLSHDLKGLSPFHLNSLMYY